MDIKKIAFKQLVSTLKVKKCIPINIDDSWYAVAGVTPIKFDTLKSKLSAIVKNIFYNLDLDLEDGPNKQDDYLPFEGEEGGIQCFNINGYGLDGSFIIDVSVVEIAPIIGEGCFVQIIAAYEED